MGLASADPARSVIENVRQVPWRTSQGYRTAAVAAPASPAPAEREPPPRSLALHSRRAGCPLEGQSRPVCWRCARCEQVLVCPGAAAAAPRRSGRRRETGLSGRCHRAGRIKAGLAGSLGRLGRGAPKCGDPGGVAGR